MEELKKDIQFIKGVGSQRASKLNRLGIYTIKDLLYYFPRTFEDRNIVKKINQLQDGEKVTIRAIISSINICRPKKGMVIVNINVKDETGCAKLSFFNRPYLKNNFRSGDTVLTYGKVKLKNSSIEINSTDIEHFTNSPNQVGKVLPVYPLTFGVTNKDILNVLKSVFNDKTIKVEEYMPKYLIDKYNLCGIDYALKNIHFPENKNSLKAALYRIIFEELLILQLGLFIYKGGRDETRGIEFKTSDKIYEIKNTLDFKLTNVQENALEDILHDMGSNKVMNRLIQGDVGSGKTIVAILALANCVYNGYQGSIMAPTEILAKQHYQSFKNILEKFDIKIELLVGSVANKNGILKRVKKGEINILIGTHALIEDRVEFKNIGLAITDEQHRFGVMQRGKLSSKGKNPDVLVMTATPIPRTLALILYGDLDISIIDKLPPGRKTVDTFAVYKNKRDIIYNSLVRNEVLCGRQVYIVCPLVDQSETIDAKAAIELAEELRLNYFSDLNVGLIHGKMKSREKESIMSDFYNKKIDVLVSTTVIEVGVNVPNATLMIVENAERFGLAQLHQLRGRVGRGEHKSYCYLIYGSNNAICKQRMQIMQDTNDGFKISEKDLQLRGTGEFFGTRQHGLPELKVANLFKHVEILKIVQEEAKELLRKDKKLKNNDYLLLKNEILYKFREIKEELALN